MDSSFFIGIVVGMLLVYIFVWLSKPGRRKRDGERPEYIDMKKKFYFDDKTKVYIFILVAIGILLLMMYAYHGDTPVTYRK